MLTLDDMFVHPGVRARMDALLDAPRGIVAIAGGEFSGKLTTVLSLAGHLRARGHHCTLVAVRPDTVRVPALERLSGIAVEDILVVPDARSDQLPAALARAAAGGVVVVDALDEATARPILECARAGGTVVAPIHTPFVGLDCAYTLRRLGIGNADLLAHFQCLASQMLLPTLCPQCRQPVTLSLDEALQVDPGADGPLQVWHEVGCPACAAERGPFSPPGTAELIALHEVILIDEASRPVFERYLDGGQLDNPLPADHVSLPEVARDLLRRGIAGLDTYRREILQNPTLRMQHQWELERRRGADAQERLQRLRRFFSPAVAELILSGAADDPTRTRRREIVVLFLDLRGFTGFAETNDPEDVMRVLRDYHAAMGELIVDQKATLERFAGDGMMVFLNDPLPVSEPAREAVRLAMRMQERFVALQAEWQRLGIELGLGIGVAQGYATLGPIGYEGRRDYGAIGTVTNLAARLCGEASSGQILVSQRVRGHLGEGFTCEAVGPLQLKGFHAPVPAHAVSWQAAA